MARVEAVRDELRQLLVQLSANRERRRHDAARRRDIYLRGRETEGVARHNRLVAHLDRLVSYLYAPDTIRFTVHLPTQELPQWHRAAEIVADELRERWSLTGADSVIAMAVEWSLVYGAMGVKVQPHPESGFGLSLIPPWDLAVLREDLTELADQQVIAHWYTLDVRQIERWVAGLPEGPAIVAEARQRSRPQGVLSTHARVIPTSVSAQGDISAFVVSDVREPSLYEATSEEPVVPFVDVWERSWYELGGTLVADWSVTTVMDDEIVVARRRNPDLGAVASPDIELEGHLPFGILRPRQIPGYFWGRSELDQLVRLQEWREEHLAELERAVERQVRPPALAKGVGDADAIQSALGQPGAIYATPEPQAALEPLATQVTGELLALLERIDQMFSDASGIPELLSEPGVPGIRSGTQLAGLAGIGGGRIRRMALSIEQSVAHIAGLAWECWRRMDQTVYQTPDGQRFLLIQLPPGVSIRVSAHSAAPIYAEQVVAKAVLLHRAGAIGLDDLVDLLDPPGRERLKIKARELARQRAEVAERMLRAQEIRAARGAPGRPPRRVTT